MKIKIKS